MALAAAAKHQDKRWSIYSTKKVIILTENLEWPGPVGGHAPSKTELHFLAISQGSGESREGFAESLDGLQQKLVSLCGAVRPPPPQACCAVLGCIVVEETGFLVIVVEADVVAVVDGKRILEIRRCELLPFAAPPAKGIPNESATTSVKQLLERGFYFSHDFDITRRLQKRLFGAETQVVRFPDGAIDQLASAEPRFVWNRQLVDPFAVQGVTSRWFTPVMQGFIQSRECKITSTASSLLLLLIARRGSRRAGTRYNARGIDDAGEVANWVETEQLVQIRDSSQAKSARGGWLSLVQVRGSAPVFWDQPSALSALTITRGPDLGAVAFEKHKQWVEEEYGRLLYVSLLSDSTSKRETEGVLTAALDQQSKMHPGTKLLHLDFHARVSTEEASFDRDLSSLTAQLAEQSFEHFGYFDATTNPPNKLQKGVVRTNCFDCLDRTNMLQCQLVWAWLLKYCGNYQSLRQLVEVREAPRATGGLDLGGFGDLLRNTVGDIGNIGIEEVARAPLHKVLCEMWADLGDAMSEHYTGVASTMGAALRRDGNTASILFEKGFRSVNRAFIAKFGDEARQRVLDLFLGKHRLPRAPGAPEIRRSAAGRLVLGQVTWNLHGQPCWQTPGVLQSLIRGACGAGAAGQHVDVMVFSFQELVELSPTNVVLHDSGDEELQREFESLATQSLSEVLGEAFLMVRSCGMVGLYIAVFIAERLRVNVKNVAAERCRSGLYGQVGNKGAVAVRLEVAETSVCALSVHLESGHGKASERAAQLSEVLQHNFTGPAFKTARPVKEHDLVVVAGDFNFRLGVPEGSNTEQLETMMQKGWPPLVGNSIEPLPIGDGYLSGRLPDYREAFEQFDELMGTREHSASLDHVRDAGLIEGPVYFPATYKLLHGAQRYDRERFPAWCDRILYTKFDVLRKHYVSLGGLSQSDHRPVAILLETSLLAMPNATLSSLPVVGNAGSDLPSVGKPTPSKEPDLLGGFKAPARVQHESDALKSIDLLGEAETIVCSTSQTAPLTTGYAAKLTPIALPGHAAAPASLSIGQLVLAEYAGGWYLANVSRISGSSCDVAWRRPNAEQWGSQEIMKRYLCSTGADETCHGKGLAIASRVRVPDGTSGVPSASISQSLAAFDPLGGSGGVRDDLLSDVQVAPSVSAPQVSPGTAALDLLS